MSSPLAAYDHISTALPLFVMPALFCHYCRCILVNDTNSCIPCMPVPVWMVNCCICQATTGLITLFRLVLVPDCLPQLCLQSFDSSALGGGVGGGGIMGRDADQSNPRTNGPDSGPSSDPAVS